MLDNESEKLGSNSVSSGTYYFFAMYSVVGILCSHVYAPTGADSKDDIFGSDVFIPIGVEPKGCRILEVLALKFPIFSPNLNISFIVIIARHLLAHSNRYI